MTFNDPNVALNPGFPSSIFVAYSMEKQSQKSRVEKAELKKLGRLGMSLQ